MKAGAAGKTDGRRTMSPLARTMDEKEITNAFCLLAASKDAAPLQLVLVCTSYEGRSRALFNDTAPRVYRPATPRALIALSSPLLRQPHPAHVYRVMPRPRPQLFCSEAARPIFGTACPLRGRLVSTFLSCPCRRSRLCGNSLSCRSLYPVRRGYDAPA